MWGLPWRSWSFCPSPPCCPSQSTTGPPPSLTTLKSSSPFLTERVLRLKIKSNYTDCYSLFPVVPRRGSLLRVLGLPEPELERRGLRGGHRRLHPRQDRVQVGGRGWDQLTTVQCCDQVRPPHQLRGAVRRERLAGRLGRGPDGDPELPLHCPHVPLHPRILRNCGHLAVLKVAAFS